MKVLKEVTWLYDQDPYSKEITVVSVDENLSDMKTFKLFLNKRIRAGYCENDTNNWTENSFYCISDQMVHGYKVRKLNPIEL